MNQEQVSESIPESIPKQMFTFIPTSNFQSTPYFTYENEVPTVPLSSDQNKMWPIDFRTQYEKYMDHLSRPTPPQMNLEPKSTLPKKEEQNLMQPDFEWRIMRRKYLDELKNNSIGPLSPNELEGRISIPIHTGPLIHMNQTSKPSSMEELYVESNLEQIF